MYANLGKETDLVSPRKLAILFAITGCWTAGSVAQDVAKDLPAKISTKHLLNCIQVTENVYSGAVPEGQLAFEELKKLGIKTVVSVDGMKPNVELAATFGLRYVHLPHGYDGISSHRLQEIAKALLELPKPVYVHCHHGKHRSPSATASACIMLNWIDREVGRKVLSIAGTNPNFRGLVQIVEESKPVDPNSIQSLSVEFKAVSEIAPFTEQMVVMDELFEKIGEGIDQHISHDDKAKLADTALLLTESYIELLRTTHDSKAEYLQWLEQGRDLSEQMETTLRRNPLQAKRSWTQLKENCTRCHQKFRDNAESPAK
jgi:protein tyrosine phosphatase (PTP) superfamily phosphohydrolase (DUF442 family)